MIPMIYQTDFCTSCPGSISFFIHISSVPNQGKVHAHDHSILIIKTNFFPSGRQTFTHTETY